MLLNRIGYSNTESRRMVYSRILIGKKRNGEPGGIICSPELRTTGRETWVLHFIIQVQAWKEWYSDISNFKFQGH